MIHICSSLFTLDGNKNTSILVVGQQGILAAPRLRVLHVCPATHEIAVGHDARELARDGAVHGLGDAKVGGEQDVKVALVNLQHCQHTARDGSCFRMMALGGCTYQRRCDGHHFPMVPRLHNGGVQPLHGLGQPVKVRGEQFVGRKVLFQHVEELHQAGGNVLGLGEVRGKGHLGGQPLERRVRGVRTRIVASRGGVADAEEARGHGVQVVDVELVEVAVAVDEHVSLERLLRGDVVPDAVVGEVVKDFHGEEEARRGDVLVPFEDGTVHNVHLVPVAARLGRREEVLVLEGGEVGGNLNDVVPRAGVHLGVYFADVVEDVEHEGASAGAHFVDEQVVVGIGC